MPSQQDWKSQKVIAKPDKVKLNSEPITSRNLREAEAREREQSEKVELG